MRSGDDFNESGFARAILTQQRMNLAGPQIKRHAFQRAHCAERFRDSVKLKQPRAHPLIDS
jgi:hypothetical protein